MLVVVRAHRVHQKMKTELRVTKRYELPQRLTKCGFLARSSFDPGTIIREGCTPTVEFWQSKGVTNALAVRRPRVNVAHTETGYARLVCIEVEWLLFEGPSTGHLAISRFRLAAVPVSL